MSEMSNNPELERFAVQLEENNRRYRTEEITRSVWTAENRRLLAAARAAGLNVTLHPFAVEDTQ